MLYVRSILLASWELIATSCMERSTPRSPADEGESNEMSSDIANLNYL